MPGSEDAAVWMLTCTFKLHQRAITGTHLCVSTVVLLSADAVLQCKSWQLILTLTKGFKNRSPVPNRLRFIECYFQRSVTWPFQLLNCPFPKISGVTRPQRWRWGWTGGLCMDEMRRRAAMGELQRLKHWYYSKCVSEEAGIAADLILKPTFAPDSSIPLEPHRTQATQRTKRATCRVQGCKILSAAVCCHPSPDEE